MNRKLYILTVISSLLFSTTLSADKSIKRYSIKSGFVAYEISGGGEIMGMKNKISGTKTLYFKNYGAVMIEEEKKSDISTGLANRNIQTHTLQKMDNVTSYSVDFKRKKILKGTDPIGSKYLSSGKNMSAQSQKMLEGFGGKKVGKDTILGLECEIWNIMGAKQCLYKGQIPLWIELNIMGLKNKTVAIKAEFEKEIADDKFTLPKYPIKILPTYVDEKKAISKQEMINAMGSEEAMLKKKKQKIYSEKGLPNSIKECVHKAQTLSAMQKCFPQ